MVFWSVLSFGNFNLLALCGLPFYCFDHFFVFFNFVPDDTSAAPSSGGPMSTQIIQNTHREFGLGAPKVRPGGARAYGRGGKYRCGLGEWRASSSKLPPVSYQPLACSYICLSYYFPVLSQNPAANHGAPPVGGKQACCSFWPGNKKNAWAGWRASVGEKRLSTQPTQSFIHYKLRKEWYRRNADISENL